MKNVVLAIATAAALSISLPASAEAANKLTDSQVAEIADRHKISPVAARGIGEALLRADAATDEKVATVSRNQAEYFFSCALADNKLQEARADHSKFNAAVQLRGICDTSVVKYVNSLIKISHEGIKSCSTTSCLNSILGITGHIGDVISTIRSQ